MIVDKEMATSILAMHEWQGLYAYIV